MSPASVLPRPPSPSASIDTPSHMKMKDRATAGDDKKEATGFILQVSDSGFAGYSRPYLNGYCRVYGH